VRVFGSVSRKEDNVTSDIDFLVEFESGRSLFDLVGLKIELEKMLNRKVDILTEKSIHPLIRENIMQDVIEL